MINDATVMHKHKRSHMFTFLNRLNAEPQSLAHSLARATGRLCAHSGNKFITRKAHGHCIIKLYVRKMIAVSIEMKPFGPNPNAPHPLVDVSQFLRRTLPKHVICLQIQWIVSTRCPSPAAAATTITVGGNDYYYDDDAVAIHFFFMRYANIVGLLRVSSFEIFCVAQKCQF